MRKGNKRWLTILLMGFVVPFVVIWIFGPVIGAYVDFLRDYVLSPLGIFEWPEWIQVPVFAVAFQVPLLILLVILQFLAERQDKADHGEGHNAQLLKLDEAKVSLATSIKYINDLQARIKAQAEKHQELSDLLASLQNASKETTDELKQKLDAIALVSRRNEMYKISITFLLGVVASLIASAIWSVFQK